MFLTDRKARPKTYYAFNNAISAVDYVVGLQIIDSQTTITTSPFTEIEIIKLRKKG